MHTPSYPRLLSTPKVGERLLRKGVPISFASASKSGEPVQRVLEAEAATTDGDHVVGCKHALGRHELIVEQRAAASTQVLQPHLPSGEAMAHR